MSQMKILERFLDTIDLPGVCEYHLMDEDIGPQIILVLDIDFIEDQQTKPGFVAKRIRDHLKNEIKKYLGMDVYVGSTAKKC